MTVTHHFGVAVLEIAAAVEIEEIEGTNSLFRRLDRRTTGSAPMVEVEADTLHLSNIEVDNPPLVLEGNKLNWAETLADMLVELMLPLVVAELVLMLTDCRVSAPDNIDRGKVVVGARETV